MQILPVMQTLLGVLAMQTLLSMLVILVLIVEFFLIILLALIIGVKPEFFEVCSCY